jgi:hypothetical protein
MMRELRLGFGVVAVFSLAAIGCDAGRRDDDAGRPDGGSVVVTDSGPRPDSGPSVDAGTPPGTDAGGGARTCSPPGSMCDLLEQDCEAGQACRFLIMAEGEEPRGLCEPAGTATVGMACTRDATSGDTCAEGLICDDGICRQYCCDGNSADCPIGQFCLGGPGDVALCREGSSCNPLDGSGCTNASQSCYLAGSDRDCFDTGTTPEGGECMFLNSCVPGHACVGDPGACRKLCDPTMGGADCPTTGSYACRGLTGVTGIGVCIPTM